jgi:ribosomal protein S18 acetylase RimI-like enzyme
VASLEIRPFADEHLDDAAALLAVRHRRHRASEPLLSSRFENPADARAELELVWRSDGASGAAAYRNGRIVGYLVGAPRTSSIWGANVWIESAGHAVEEAETIRDLYAAAAAAWVEEGQLRHSAIVPADADLLDAWWRLCFGQQQAHGIAAVPPETTVTVPDGFEIHPPREEEIEQMIDLDLALPRHQQASPVFSEIALPTPDEVRQEWDETLAAADEEILIGSFEGRPVACWAFAPVEQSSGHAGLARPDRAAILSFAVTLPEFRGSGIGVALTHAVFARAAELGYEVVVTDWRVTNLLSSRFWPKRGFRISFLRLYRSIP